MLVVVSAISHAPASLWTSGASDGLKGLNLSRRVWSDGCSDKILTFNQASPGSPDRVGSRKRYGASCPAGRASEPRNDPVGSFRVLAVRLAELFEHHLLFLANPEQVLGDEGDNQR